MIDYSIEGPLQVSGRPIIKIAKFSRSGHNLALLTADKYINIVDTHNYQRKHSIDCNNYSEVRDIEFSTNSAIIGAAADRELALFGITNRKFFRSFSPTDLCSDLTHDYFSLVSFGLPTVLVGASTKHHAIHIYYNYEDPTNYCVSVSPHNCIITSIRVLSKLAIITSYADGVCLKWNYAQQIRDIPPERIQPDDERFVNPTMKITHTALSIDSRYLLLTHACSKLSSYKCKEAELLLHGISKTITFFRTYEGHIGIVQGEFEIKGTFLFYGKEKFVIAGSETCYIYIWDFETAVFVRMLDCKGAVPVSIIYNQLENLERFAVLQKNGELFIWKRSRPVIAKIDRIRRYFPLEFE